MKLQRDEVLTGVLVIVTFAVVVATLLALGAPGLFGSLNTYYVFFDNAGGIQAGTEVFLAGRRVGQVMDLESPVPAARRPPDHPDYEVLIKVQVSKEARIYQQVTVRMQQYGWFGQQMIDFAQGWEESGLAPSGTTFVGERVPGITEVSEEATNALHALTEALVNIKDLTDKSGDLSKTVANARDLSETIKREPWRLIWKSKKHAADETKKK